MNAATSFSANPGNAQCLWSWTVSDTVGVASQKVYVSTTNPVTIVGGNLKTTIANNTTQFYVQGSLTNGTPYYGKHVVTDAYANTTVTSQAVCTPAIPAPTSFSCSNGGSGNATCGWNAVEGADSYKIYRKAGIGVTTANDSSVAGSNSKNVTDLTNEQWCFAVVAVISGNDSALSTENCATVTGAVEAPVLDTVAAAGPSGMLGVSWSAVEGESDVGVSKLGSKEQGQRSKVRLVLKV